MTKTLGMKFDSEKRRMGLLPPRALESVADVLTFGAKKYLPDNWRYVENGPERYLDAALRHISAYMKGEPLDEETGLPHLSHALCCLMFIVDLQLEEQEQEYYMSDDYYSSGNSFEASNVELTNKTKTLREVITEMVQERQAEEERMVRDTDNISLHNVINNIIRQGKKDTQ